MITKYKDSYVTLDEANIYFSSVLNSTEWDEADDIRKEKSLKMATRQIDKLPFQGRKSDKYQMLEFPRNITTMAFADGIPQAIVYATCEQALFLLNGGSKRQELQKQGVKSYSLGDLSETFADNLTDVQKNVCPEALSYLKKYLLGSVAIC